MKGIINPAIAFICLALLALLFGATAGLLSGMQYLQPEYLKTVLPFHHLRELHVSSVVGWIVLAAIGGIYFYIPTAIRLEWKYPRAMRWHFWLYLGTSILIIWSLLSGTMGGREYMSFSPWLLVPVIVGWGIIAVNYFKTVVGQIRSWPVYLWMWGTGLIFIIFHLCEANLWLFDWFRLHFIRDLTVQWKSYGSVVGSWNMLVYGTAIFLMSRLKDDGIARSKTAFFFYFLGLTNLMLGWAHHIYPVPGESWVRGLSYAISMTEWVVLASMLTGWLKSVKKTERKPIRFPYTFLLVTDIWIFFNVLIALLISIPAINHYTHGTHITVAHSMGTTVGINTSILLASIMFIASQLNPSGLIKHRRVLALGMLIFNISLFLFLASLLMAGYTKGMMMYEPNVYHSLIMDAIKPYIEIFHWAGGTLLLAFFLIAIPMLKILLPFCWKKP